LELAHPRQSLEVDHPRGPRDAVFEHGEQVLAAGQRLRSLVRFPGRRAQRLQRLIETAGRHPFEGVHGHPLALRPARILSGVIGRSCTRTPQALNTAFARAPTLAMIGGSPTPITPSRVSPSSMIGTISGISRAPGTL